MNESYLDPDIHLWPECPDDRCYHCGYVFPADLEIEEDTPQWEGFCCQQCLDDSNQGKPTPNHIRPMEQALTSWLGRDDAEGWNKSVYKGTDCGAWLSAGQDYIELGSIVEGSDVEVGPIPLEWPFTQEQFWSALGEINEEAKFYWDRDNSIWFIVEFSPVGKPKTTYYGKNTWGELDLDAPDYVREKVRQFFEKGLDTVVGRKIGIALGVTIEEYINDGVF